MINIENNFNELVLNNKNISVVDFWAPWCIPCKIFSTTFENVENAITNINFYKLNVENDKKNIAKKYGVMTIPTIILFKDGKEIKRNIGVLNEENLKKFLDT